MCNGEHMNTLLTVLRICTVPLLTLLGWLVVLVIHAMWGRRLFWWEGALCTVLKEDSWPVNDKKKLGGWYLLKKKRADGTEYKLPWGGTTLMPYAIMVSENGMNTITMHHEMRHVRQSVQRGFTFFFVGLIVAFTGIPSGLWWLGIVIWLVAPYGPLVSGAATILESITNVVGGHRGRAYYDNMMEQHARGARNEVNFHRLDDVLDGKVDRADVYKEPPAW